MEPAAIETEPVTETETETEPVTETETETEPVTNELVLEPDQYVTIDDFNKNFTDISSIILFSTFLLAGFFTMLEIFRGTKI